jgi:quercetin dioxygenase-like cupin family protein
VSISGQDVPLPIDGIRISDETFKLDRHPVQYDPEMGVSTAHLGVGSLYQTDLILVEIPPGAQSQPDRHLSEEFIYIVAGEGYTTMWVRPNETPQRYEWSAGDLLSPSLNAWHQHFNSSETETLRYISLTTEPLVNNLFNDPGFVFSTDHVFEDRWNYSIAQKPEYVAPDVLEGRNNIDMRSGHLLGNLPGRKMKQRRNNVLGINTRPSGDLAGNHILELSIREYHDRERHPSQYPRETIVYILAGEGSTILKRGDAPARMVNWEAGDLFIVEANEHFDNGARMDAIMTPPFPRILMLKPAGYFIGIGNIVPGSNQYSTQ